MTPVCVVLETPDTMIVRADSSLTAEQLLSVAATVLKSALHRGVSLQAILDSLDDYDVVTDTCIPQPSVN